MNTHDYRIDRLRLLACFGVVMLHSSYGSGAGDLMLNALFRFSVPVFVIISGYFMLSSSVNIFKKTLHLFVQMIFCSSIYLFFWGSMSKSPIVYLLTEPVHLWYLYATMGLYLLTPVLQPFVRSAERREYQYTLIIFFLLGSCVVTLNRLGWVPLIGIILDKSKLPVTLCFTGLYLLGGYFRKFGISNRKEWMMIGILSTLAGMLVSGTTVAQILLSFFSPNVVLSGCACFVLCMVLPDVPERFRRSVGELSKCTMGVYLFHLLVSDWITPFLCVSRQLLGGVVAMSIRGISVFTLTIIMVWILRKIPVLRKWVL